MNKVDAMYYQTTAQSFFDGSIPFDDKNPHHLLIREKVELGIEADFYSRRFVSVFMQWICNSESNNR